MTMVTTFSRYTGADWWKILRKSIEVQGDQQRIWSFLDMLENGKGHIGSLAIPTAEVPAATRAHVRIVIKKHIRYLVNIGFLLKPNKRRKLPKLT